MSPDSKRLYEEAMRLSTEERAALAGRLLESLDEEPPDEGVEAAWDAEIARRIDEIDSGKARLIPWSEVRRQLMSIIDAKRSR